MKNLLLGMSLLVSGLSYSAVEYDSLKCVYDAELEAEELKNAVFTLNGILKVESEESATLQATAMMRYPEGSDASSSWKDYVIEENVHLSVGDTKNDPTYKGRKYSNHYKFDLKWYNLEDRFETRLDGGQVSYDLDKASLIISKTPVKAGEVISRTQNMDTFDAVLDVSYNDHHGDYVKLKCTRIYSNRR